MQEDNLYKELEEFAKKENIEIFKISAVTGEGLKELFNHVAEVLKKLPKEEIIEKDEKIVYTLEEEKQGFEIIKENGEFIVEGPDVDKLMGRVNLEDNESLYFFQKMLENLGINKALRDEGIQEGDTVRFKDWEFSWYN